MHGGRSVERLCTLWVQNFLVKEDRDRGYDFSESHGAGNGARVRLCRNKNKICLFIPMTNTNDVYFISTSTTMVHCTLQLPLQWKEKKRLPLIEPAGATSPSQKLPNDVKPFVSAEQTRKEVGCQKCTSQFSKSRKLTFTMSTDKQNIFSSTMNHQPVAHKIEIFGCKNLC